MRLSLVCMSIVSVFSLISCAQFEGRSRAAGSPQGGSVDPAQNGVVIYPVAAAAPVATAFSRYVAETPHAVECIDKLVAMGYPEAATIENAVARNTITRRDNIIAVADYNATAVPVLNVISLDAFQSNVDMRLFNPMGYYCIVSSVTFNSALTIQRNCSSKLVTMFSQNTRAGVYFWGWHRPISSTTQQGVASLEELPCIP